MNEIDLDELISAAPAADIASTETSDVASEASPGLRNDMLAGSFVGSRDTARGVSAPQGLGLLLCGALRKLLLQALPTLLRYCNVRHSVKVRAWVREARETTVRTMQVFCVE